MVAEDVARQGEAMRGIVTIQSTVNQGIQLVDSILSHFSEVIQ